MMQPMAVSWTCLLLSLAAISTVHGAGLLCQHKDDVEHAVHGVYLEPHQHVAKRVANQPMRFNVSYDSSISQLQATVQSRIMAIMPNLTSFLSQTLQVKPVGVPILLDRACTGGSFTVINGLHYCASTCQSTTMCGQATVPTSHLQACRQCNGSTLQSSCVQTGTNGTGVPNADYIFYVSAVSTSVCGTGTSNTPTTIAFATYCQTESSLDRPIAGNINFCPSAFTSSSNDDFVLAVANHEAQHALGFSSGLFPFWRDQNGVPRTPRDATFNLPPFANGAYQYSNTTVMPLTYNNWAVSTGTISHPVNLLVTPTVVAAAKIYFNCSSLIGVELENQGTPATVISHWEKRILGNELMTGVLTFNPLFSNLTLAALQDTGWYQVNYSMAQPLVWGNGAGCQFASGSCGGYITSRLASGSSIDPFCNHNSAAGINQLGCTIDRGAVSYCNLKSYGSPLPVDYQYFPALGSSYGGADLLADYCPYQDLFIYSGDTRETVCTNVTNNINPPGINNLGETYGPGSVCVNQGSQGWSVTYSGTTYTPNLSGAGCYQFMYTNGSVSIGVLGVVYSCLAAGQQVNVSVTVNGAKYDGSLLCPPYNQLPAAGGQITPPTTTSVSTPPITTTSAGILPPTPNMVLLFAGWLLPLLGVLC